MLSPSQEGRASALLLTSLIREGWFPQQSANEMQRVLLQICVAHSGPAFPTFRDFYQKNPKTEGIFLEFDENREISS